MGLQSYVTKPRIYSLSSTNEESDVSKNLDYVKKMSTLASATEAGPSREMNSGEGTEDYKRLLRAEISEQLDQKLKEAIGEPRDSESKKSKFSGDGGNSHEHHDSKVLAVVRILLPELMINAGNIGGEFGGDDRSESDRFGDDDDSHETFNSKVLQVVKILLPELLVKLRNRGEEFGHDERSGSESQTQSFGDLVGDMSKEEGVVSSTRRNHDVVFVDPLFPSFESDDRDYNEGRLDNSGKGEIVGPEEGSEAFEDLQRGQIPLFEGIHTTPDDPSLLAVGDIMKSEGRSGSEFQAQNVGDLVGDVSKEEEVFPSFKSEDPDYNEGKLDNSGKGEIVEAEEGSEAFGDLQRGQMTSFEGIHKTPEDPSLLSLVDLTKKSEGDLESSAPSDVPLQSVNIGEEYGRDERSGSESQAQSFGDLVGDGSTEEGVVSSTRRKRDVFVDPLFPSSELEDPDCSEGRSDNSGNSETVGAEEGSEALGDLHTIPDDPSLLASVDDTKVTEEAEVPIPQRNTKQLTGNSPQVNVDAIEPNEGIKTKLPEDSIEVPLEDLKLNEKSDRDDANFVVVVDPLEISDEYDGEYDVPRRACGNNKIMVDKIGALRTLLPEHWSGCVDAGSVLKAIFKHPNAWSAFERYFSQRAGNPRDTWAGV
ncbi:uncharacterized protein LOC107041197 [Diachasma alloeum]|uniref:uncharacterized protein LOC107041197 n=1 Tax=Diachasma alloeum TaxID=454923 RepID=UPI0007384FC2|nr:uncharacterized protein LOC107041197 [Diachasma alloeum]